jgi:multidrug efflux pump subunit AcrB
MFSSTSEQFFSDYQYNPTPLSILNYTDYSNNNYNSSFIIFFYFKIFIIVYLFLVSSYQPSSSLIPLQDQTVSTIKIHINPFFRPHSSNQTNESLSEIKQQQQHNSSVSSRNRSRSRSPPTDRQLIISSNKKKENRQNRKAQRKKFRQEKELMCKKQLSTKSKHSRSSPDRWEHKDEKLKRLYKKYSNEDPFTQWKPLLLKDCFELYEYAFEKYYGTSINN